MSISLKRKLEIIDECEKSSGEKKEDLAKRLGLKSASTLCTILAQKASLREKFASLSKHDQIHRKTAKMETRKDVEEAVLLWFREARRRNVPISGPVIQAKAEEFGQRLGYKEFKASNGWLNRFKHRHSIVCRAICGESASVDDEIVDDWAAQKLPKLIKGYKMRDIYNADESGLFYRLLPNRTLTEQDRDCKGGKKSKERLTIMPCCNWDGSDKMKLVVIGKYANPRCFMKTQPKSVQYCSNKNAWMLSGLFETWVRDFDRDMDKQNRKVLLFVDNCSAHPEITDLKAVKLVFFPPNTTSKLQPMDQGIIEAMKKLYRKKMIQKMLICMGDDGKGELPVFHVLDAINMIKSAWDEIEVATIMKCFRKGGFVDRSNEAEVENDATAEPAPTESETGPNRGIIDSGRTMFERITAHYGINMDYMDFINVDSTIETRQESLSDTDIVQKLRGESEDDVVNQEADEEEPEPTVPAHAVALKYVSELRNYFCKHGTGGVDSLIGNLEKACLQTATNVGTKQTKVTDFFKSD